MPSNDTDDLGHDAHETEGVARQRKNANKQANTGISGDHSDAPAYTEEQYEAVKRYILSVQSDTICTVHYAVFLESCGWHKMSKLL